MKVKIEKTEEYEVDSFRLEGLKIAGKEHSLTIKQMNDFIEFLFDYPERPDIFSAAAFTIRINKDGVSFERFLERLGHDHNDSQDLVVYPNKELSWDSGYHEESKKFVVPFGKKIRRE